MPNASKDPNSLQIRPFQYRDLDGIERLMTQATVGQDEEASQAIAQWLRRWYGPLKVLSWVPNPWRHLADFRVAERDPAEFGRAHRKILGLIQVTPTNRSRSTWQISRVVAEGGTTERGDLELASDVGSQLLRHCLEMIWEARTWISEVDVTDESSVALYRQNGFQPLAQITQWQMAPETLQALAERTPDLPNLLPVSNADAHLLYQLDTVAMPPLLRQVFDRHVQDFRTSLSRTLVSSAHRMVEGTDRVSGYVFEPQRKAAIGHVRLNLSRHGDRPHQAELTVHPAYTWLYPELMVHMAQVLQAYPPVPLQLTSADYQPEREECFQQLKAEPIQHRLLLSRSVWHKLRESRGVSIERLQIAEMLQGFQPNRQPIPGRISLDACSSSELFWDRWDYASLQDPQMLDWWRSPSDRFRSNSRPPWPESQR